MGKYQRLRVTIYLGFQDRRWTL